MIAAMLTSFLLSIDPLAKPGQPPVGIPPEVADLAFEQRIGSQAPLNLEFRDEEGRKVRLEEFARRRPVILVLAYYRCPQLCNLVLNGLFDGLKNVPYQIGEEYEIVVVSFDARETSDIAAAKKANYLQSYGRPGADRGCHFLTGDQPQIERLAEAVGFKFSYDAKHDRFNHPSGVIVLTPDGRVSRYLFGIRYLPRDLKLSIMEASEGRLGTLTDQLLLFCFHYDADTGAYAFAVKNAVRAGGVITVVLMGLMLVRFWRKELKKPNSQSEAVA